MSEIHDIKIKFDIYGPIESDDYWNECKKAIKELPSNINAQYIGMLTQEEVAPTFMKYDCFLLLSH